MSRREFSATVRRQAIDRAGGICQICGNRVDLGKRQFEVDHILPDALGGKPVLSNAMFVCKPCHRKKTGEEDVPRIRKSDRQRNKHIGAEAPKQKIQSRGFPRRPKRGRIELPNTLPPPPLMRAKQERQDA